MGARKGIEKSPGELRSLAGRLSSLLLRFCSSVFFLAHGSQPSKSSSGRQTLLFVGLIQSSQTDRRPGPKPSRPLASSFVVVSSRPFRPQTVTSRPLRPPVADAGINSIIIMIIIIDSIILPLAHPEHPNEREGYRQSSSSWLFGLLWYLL